MYDYDYYDAKADAESEAWYDAVSEELHRLVQPIMDQAEVADEEMPRPWTFERELLAVWLTEGEDAARDILEEMYRDEAEDRAREGRPCCYDYYCPCGNTNNYRG